MCKKHLFGFQISEKGKNNPIVRFVMFVVVLSFAFLQVAHAQQTQTTQKPKTGTTLKPRSDSAPIHTTAKPKKDTTHHQATVQQKPAASTNTNKPQRTDSLVKKKNTTVIIPNQRKDSTITAVHPIHRATTDSAPKAAAHPATTHPNRDLWAKTLTVPYLPLKAKPIFVMDEPHPYESKDLLFFMVCGLFILYGIVRTAFPKYTDSLFQNLVSFSSIGKSDTNMGQNNLPSLLLNILFCLSLGLLGTLIIQQTKDVSLPFWQIWLLGSAVLGTIYLVKSLTIYLSGWIFNASVDARSYMYVVFMVNKIIGVLSLPAILIFAFAENPQLNQYIITIGSILLIVLLLYRYVVTFSLMARNLQLNALHFFLYLCSVEIIPILILYKLFFKDLTNWI